MARILKAIFLPTIVFLSIFALTSYILYTSKTMFDTKKIVQTLFEAHDRIVRDTSYIDIGGVNCTKLFADDPEEQESAAYFTFDGTLLEDTLKWENYSCSTFQRLFPFFTEPLSKEEADFPLAYGMLVHKEPTQILYMLSAIYQPQNQFCMAIDEKSDDDFYTIMQGLATCYSNIHVFKVGDIKWCGFNVLEAVFDCVKQLSNLKSPWKYYQYLSGVDAPLKTNLEMVRIFKALNGSFNAEIVPYERYRLAKKNQHNSPLHLVKTSLSATFSRESADYMIKSALVQRQLEFLNGTVCPDESLWATIAGSPQDNPMPGAFDAVDFITRNFYTVQVGRQHYMSKRRKPKTPPDLDASSLVYFDVDNYYISRYQQWSLRKGSICLGMYYRYSCVYGIRDLPRLVRRPELIAHKLYMGYQPATFLCLIQEIRRRSLAPTKFTGDEYRNLPGAPKRIEML